MTDLAALIGHYANSTAPGRRAHIATARNTVASLLNFSTTLSDRFREAQTFEDPSLSDQGLAEARAAKVETVLGTIAAVTTGAKNEAAGALKAAETATGPHRPKYDPENVAQVVRTEQAWSAIIRPQLEAGKGWDEVVSVLDHDGLLAIERFAEPFEAGRRDKKDRHEVAPLIENVRKLAEDRLVQIAPEGPARDALTELAEVRQLHGTAERAANALAAVSGPGSSLMSAQLTVKREAYAADANPTAVAAAMAASAAA